MASSSNQYRIARQIRTKLELRDKIRQQIIEENTYAAKDQAVRDEAEARDLFNEFLRYEL